MSDIALKYVNSENIEQALIAINELSTALLVGAYSSTLPGLLKGDGGTEENNAYDFLCEYYPMTSAALHLISATSAIISESIINDEITIAAKGSA